MRSTRGRSRPVTAALLLGGLLPAFLLPERGAAQSTERRYEAFATGAATTIYPDEVGDGATDVVDLLQWNVPGLMVTRFPNGGVSLSMRQACLPPPSLDPGGPEPETIPNPLVIVDGVPVSNANVSWELLNLDPAMVERIELVRDLASTSMWGKRAGCGVLRIFTRRR